MKLTAQDIADMAPETVFADGYIGDNQWGCNMTNSGSCLRWAAVRGEGRDWAIYVHWPSWKIKDIVRSGEKIRDINHVRRVIDCTEAALHLYRL